MVAVMSAGRALGQRRLFPACRMLIRSCAGQTAESMCMWLFAVRLLEALMSDARRYVSAAAAGCTGTGSCVHTSWSGVAACQSPGHQMTVEASGT